MPNLCFDMVAYGKTRLCDKPFRITKGHVHTQTLLNLKAKSSKEILRKYQKNEKQDHREDEQNTTPGPLFFDIIRT